VPEREQADAMARFMDDAFWTSWIRALRDGILAVPGLPEEERPEMAGSFDYIGFSYYFAMSVFADGSAGPYPADARTNLMGFAPWPEGLGIVLRRLESELPGRPLLVAECGVGTDDDSWRTEILDASLQEVARAVDDGVDVRGLFHWTGVDNYEWNLGFDLPFGLLDRDRNAKGSAALARRWATGEG
jgi:beta-glucosidase